MADFKVGDKVFLECEVRDTYAGKYVVTTHSDVKIYISTEQLIPAHRVTIAPTRRAAEFPRDFNRDVYWTDERGNERLVRLIGKDNDELVVTDEVHYMNVESAEVEE
jgi:hypothetical protein